MSNSLKLSVIVPIYNEERYIEACVASLLAQDFPQEEMELLLVDGASTDRTPELLEKLAQEHPSVIRVLQNPKRIQSAAMNLGAKAARGAYLIRVDAHADYPPNYFSRCVSLMEETGAQNVGCIWNTQGKTPKVKPTKACGACSLKELCLPKLMRSKSVSSYLRHAMEESP